MEIKDIERLTDDARRVMKFADQEARRLNYEYIGTEHILLGLIKEEEGKVAEILREQNCTYKQIREELKKIVKPLPDVITMGTLPQTPRAKSVMDYAVECAQERQGKEVDTEDILYGLIKEEEGIAAQILMNLGFKKEKLEESLSQKIAKTEEPEYWLIPRKEIPLKTVLSHFGFELGNRKNPLQNYTPIVKVQDSREIGRLIGDENICPSVSILYYLDNMNRIDDAMKLRDALKINKVRYTEQPPAAEFAELLQERSKTLVEKLIGPEE